MDMSIILKGVMQSTVTPLKEDFSLDTPTFERLLDFHVRTGATAISWPHHKGESLNLTIAERKHFAEAAVKTVSGRIPVSIHVGSLAVEDSLILARHARQIGADAIIAITPYFWRPSAEALYDYFVELGTAVDLPLIVYNSPDRLGTEITGDLIRRLIERLPNLIAMKEASFHSETFVEISRAVHAVKPSFSMIAGVEFLAPSVPLGCVGSYSAAGTICPNLCTQLYEACISGQSVRARELQYKMIRLWDLFRDQYPSSLKGGMVLMGRPVGPTRPPLPTASKERRAFIAEELKDLGILDTEPYGW
jgi:4-hydroxy-tetrahydrodipicolinate synthase